MRGSSCSDSDSTLLTAYFYGTHILLDIAALWLTRDTGIDHYDAILQAAKLIANHPIGCAHVRVTAPLLFDGNASSKHCTETERFCVY
jgi:hypothetical protein